MVLEAVDITMFVLAGAVFVLINLLLGKLIRPHLPNAQKTDIYECGEITIGSSWVQFDLRFYVVALLFVIFDVEIALLYPWARVFRQYAAAAFWDLLFFMGLLLVGFAYLWKYGYLDWVRSTATAAKDRPAQAAENRDPQTRPARQAGWTDDR